MTNTRDEKEELFLRLNVARIVLAEEEEEEEEARTVVSLLDITERKRAEEALERSLKETANSRDLLLSLSKAAQAVQRAHTREEIFRAVGDEIVKLGYHNVILTLSDDQTVMTVSSLTMAPNLLREAEKLAGISLSDFRWPLPLDSPVQRIINGGRSIFEATGGLLAKDLPKPLNLLADQLIALFGIRQSIIAPLMVGGRVYGLLVVTGIGLTEAHIPAVTAFANQAAIAIENAQLFEQV
ncbi:MAG: GAF domain-containing protein, partial [Chloroflexota bacterium]|nr:GAF domain-containing protein [Chloroflexota bacterium]